jgi:hypothetical protein
VILNELYIKIYMFLKYSHKEIIIISKRTDQCLLFQVGFKVILIKKFIGKVIHKKKIYRTLQKKTKVSVGLIDSYWSITKYVHVMISVHTYIRFR